MNNQTSITGESLVTPLKIDQAPFKKIFKSREFSLALIVTGAFIGLSLLSPTFLTYDNLRSITSGMGYELLLASGMSLVLILAGIDLSVGSVIALTSVVGTLLLKENWFPVWFSVLLILGFAGMLGGINGFGVSVLQIPPFIVTLGMFSIARGVAIVISGGNQITGLPESFTAIADTEWLGVPAFIVVIVLLLFVFDLLLRYWKPLNNAFYIGNNLKAAELSGIQVKWIIFSGYLIIGVLAGVASITISAQTRMGYAQFGMGAELNAIAAAVIGGSSLMGGAGSVLGACLGVLFLAIINNGFVLLGFNINWQYVINGGTLLLFIAINAYQRRNQRV